MTEFVEGPPCKKCGGTKRYANGRHCVACKAQKLKSLSRDYRNDVNRRSWAKLSRERQRERGRRSHLKLSYDLTLEEYEAMYSEQGGKCAICDTHHAILCVDHNHDTLKVRGLLCIKCNAGIGNLSDSVMVISRALSYLNNYNKLEEENGSLDPL